jgi:hypothetical protein
MNRMRSRPFLGRIAATTLETLAWVGLATALVALLDSVATPAGLGSLYLIAVLAVAIRRGQVAALAAAVLGVLILNFFFIQPLHQLTISDSDNVVALGVLLLAALVVGRLAGQSRQRAAEAELRAKQAAAREREAVMLADAATALLGGSGDVVVAISTSLDAAGQGELRHFVGGGAADGGGLIGGWPGPPGPPGPPGMPPGIPPIPGCPIPGPIPGMPGPAGAGAICASAASSRV